MSGAAALAAEGTQQSRCRTILRVHQGCEDKEEVLPLKRKTLFGEGEAIIYNVWEKREDIMLSEIS